MRQALQNANGASGANLITFNIPGDGVHIIQPLSTLPDITSTVTIDGTSQPGYAGKPLIELDGQNTQSFGLLLFSANSMIRGLIVNRFMNTGIFVSKGGRFTPFNFLITDNYIGTDATGMIAAGNGIGIQVGGGTGTIGGSLPAQRNVISGNTADGIHVINDFFLQIFGNSIGVAADGTIPLGNGHDGVNLDHSNSATVGGQQVSVGSAQGNFGNIIAFNGNDGIEDQSSNGVTFIGPNVTYNHGNTYLSNSIHDNALLGIGVDYNKQYLRAS